MGELFNELKRRNVIRVAVAYAVAAWVLLQIADLVLDNINAPDWVIQAFMLALGLGFPLVLVFSWAFELTPEGLKREKDVERDRSVTHQTAKKLDLITIGLLALVLVVVVVERRLFPAVEAPAEPAAALTTADSKSIAVLAFEDMSPQKDQEYFADGLSEELLNLLAKVPDLQVAGRTSSFAFKGQHRDLREIGEILNVAHVLEGSVRKSGDNIRVTAQLVNTANGFHLFSDTYDDELSDVFKVQDEIAGKITAALKAKLIGEDTNDEVSVTDVRAYELYLEARQKLHTRDGIEMTEASALLDAALVIDPDYAPALAQKALALALLSDSPGSYGDIPADIAYAQATQFLDKALALAPDLAEAHAVRGLILPWPTQADQAEWHLERALAINPNLDNASLWLANLLEFRGKEAEAQALLEKVVERDPLFTPALGNLVADYIVRREYDRATALIDRHERAAGKTSAGSNARARIAVDQGRYADGIRHYRDAFEMDPSSTVMRFNYGFALWTIGDFESLPALETPVFDVIYWLHVGEIEKAREVAQSVPVSTDDLRGFRMRTYLYASVGEFERIPALVDEHFGSLDGILERYPRTNEEGLSHMTDLALAYRELGREADFQKCMQAIRVALDAQRERSVHPLSLLYGEASYAALAGDVDALVEVAREIVREDDVDVDALRSPELEAYRDEPRLEPMLAELRARGNAERAKLGLPPYQPPGFGER